MDLCSFSLLIVYSESMIWGPLCAVSELRAGDKGEKANELLPGKEAGYGVSRATRELPYGPYMSPSHYILSISW